VWVELAGLAVANLAYLVVGCAAFVAGGWVTDEPATWYRLGAAYLFGIVVVVVPASYAALLGIPVGITAAGVGIAVVAAGVWRGRSFRRRHVPRPNLGSVEAVAALAVGAITVVVLVYAARTFLVRPLVEYDAWAIWAAKARLLYQDAGGAPGALRSGLYGQAPYPLALPTLQALGFGAMGRFDGTLIGAQFVALPFGFVAALWSLLAGRARPFVIALAALAIVAAPQMLYQLATHYSDVPLGLFVGLGVAAAAAWTARPDGDNWRLACAVAFLGMAGLTKSEGQLFAAAAVGALILAQLGAGWRPRLRPTLVAVAALAAILAPWRLYCAAYGLTTPDYDLANVTNVGYLRDHSDRLRPVLSELWRQLDAPGKWGWLVLAAALGILSGLVGRQFRLTAFAAAWLTLAGGGLILVYWVSTLPTESHLTNSSYRTIVSLLVGATSLLPLLVGRDPLGLDVQVDAEQDQRPQEDRE